MPNFKLFRYFSQWRKRCQKILKICCSLNFLYIHSYTIAWNFGNTNLFSIKIQYFGLQLCSFENWFRKGFKIMLIIVLWSNEKSLRSKPCLLNRGWCTENFWRQCMCLFNSLSIPSLQFLIPFHWSTYVFCKKMCLWFNFINFYTIY